MICDSDKEVERETCQTMRLCPPGNTAV